MSGGKGWLVLAVLGIGACKADPPETRAPATSVDRSNDASPIAQARPLDAATRGEAMISDEDKLAAIRRTGEIRARMEAWAGPDARVKPWDRPVVEGLTFFNVKGGKSRPDTPGARYGRGRTVVWVDDRDAALESGEAMQAVAAATADPDTLAEAALLIFLGGGFVADPEQAPAALRDRMGPPVLEGDKLTFWGRVPAVRGLRLALVELDLATMKLETTSPREE
jgi:hypothetical protein